MLNKFKKARVYYIRFKGNMMFCDKYNYIVMNSSVFCLISMALFRDGPAQRFSKPVMLKQGIHFPFSSQDTIGANPKFTFLIEVHTDNFCLHFFLNLPIPREIHNFKVILIQDSSILFLELTCVYQFIALSGTAQD